MSESPSITIHVWYSLDHPATDGNASGRWYYALPDRRFHCCSNVAIFLTSVTLPLRDSRKTCLTDSIVQSYIDLELAKEAMVSTLAHIDACSKCKHVVSEAISEQHLVTTALAHEMELPVPSVRLRARIESVIKDRARMTSL